MIIVIMIIITGHFDKLTAIRRMKTKKDELHSSLQSEIASCYNYIISNSMLFSGEAQQKIGCKILYCQYVALLASSSAASSLKFLTNTKCFSDIL